MKIQKLTLIALALLISTAGLWAQEKKQDEKKEKHQMVIIKKTVDENGKEVVERIVKDIDAEGEHHFEYQGEDGEIIELKMDGDHQWHSISEDIHIIGDGDEDLNIIDIKDVDKMTEELKEKMIELNVEVDNIDTEKLIKIRMKDENGEDKVFEWKGDGEIPEDVRQKMKEHHLHQGKFENNVFFQNTSSKAFLGVVSGKKVEVKNENGVETRTEEDHNDVDGAYIEEVVEGSAAEAAGLQGGDVITDIDGTDISSFSDLSKKLSNYEVGDQISITYTRNNATAQTTATLGERKNVAKDFTFEWKDEDGEELQFGEGQKFFFKSDDDAGDEDRHVIILENEDGEKGVDVKKRIVIVTKANSDVDVDTETEVMVTVITDEDDAEEDEVVEVPAPGIEVSPEHQLAIENFDAYPNPTEGQIQVKFSAPAAPTTLVITDTSGREVYRDTVRNFDGNYNKQINLAGVAKGALVLRVSQEDKIFTQQIILQ